MKMNPFTTEQWIAWLTATIIAAVSMMAYAHTNFVTVREKDDIYRQLLLIHKKVDYLYEQARDTK